MKTYAAFVTIALGGLSAALLSGCVVTGTVSDHHPRPVYVERPAPVIVEPPPPVVVERPAPPPAVMVQPPAPAQVIVVRQPPPPLRGEVVPPRPSAEVVWVPGYYSPQGSAWIWVGGHYERPPRRGAVWVPPRHEVRGSDRVEVSLGFWR
jgi:hypothetical protein